MSSFKTSTRNQGVGKQPDLVSKSMGHIIGGPLPEAPTRATGCRKFVENKILAQILGLQLVKLENLRNFSQNLPYFKAKYQENGSGDRPLSTAGVVNIFYHLPTKVGNLPDRVDSFPTGEMSPTLVWCHPCSNDDQSPHFLTFFGLIQEHKSSNRNKKLSAPLSRCRLLIFFIYV